jgi:hypothetical protein
MRAKPNTYGYRRHLLNENKEVKVVDIKAKVKKDTLVYKNILDKQSASKISSGTLIHINGIHRYGLKSYYIIPGNKYIECDAIKIIRDSDFYYENYSSKKLQKNNLALLGAKTLSDALDDIKEEYTSPYIDLQLFASQASGWANRNDMVVNGIPTTVGGGFGGALAGGTSSAGAPIRVGGVNGGIISTTSPSATSANVANTSIGNLAGLNANSTGGKLLNNVPIGSLFDGSFLSRVATNLLNMIAGFFGNKMKFVIGFSFAAGESKSTFINGYNNAKGNWTGSTGDTISRPEVTITYYGTGGSVIPDQYTQKQLPVTPVNTAYQKYFTQYGYLIPLEGDLLSSRNVDKIADSKYKFMEDYHTGTVSPTKPAAETQFFQNISNADYSEVKSAIEKVRDELNLDIDRETTFKKFNRFRVPTPNNELTNTRGHIFFTRPDMNLVGSHEEIRSGNRTRVDHYSQISPLFDNMNKAHSVLMSYLQGNMASGGDNMIPILSHACTGIDVADEILETVEAHESFTGWKVIYGKSNVKSKTGGTLNIAFVDDNMLSVYKILKVWTEYISAVYRGEIAPKDKYGGMHILDYAISIYYFLCKENDEDILFWTKYTGCFPTATPASNFSDTIDKRIERPTYSVPFSFAKKSDYNPIDIYEFNRLTESLGYKYLKTYNMDTRMVQKSFMGAPFVDTLDGTHLYKLRFRAPSS